MATGQTSVGTAREHMEQTIEVMRRYNVVLGAVCSVPADGRSVMGAWTAYAPDMVLRGIAPDDPAEFMDPSSYRELAHAGGVDVACEVGSQYVGLSPSDPAYGPYWAIAEELGIPVGVHTGPSAPGAGPGFRIRLGNPLLLEDVLAEHPNLKVYLMHAGGAGPFMDYALYMMAVYPQVYVDIGILTWAPGGKEVLEELLRKAKQWGVLDRVMFGSDQMLWPEAIGMAVERVNGYDFLTVEERAGIFYDNAARFLGLSEE
jgi:predicted TIM-barrel fold metal-dependent hydrolase